MTHIKLLYYIQFPFVRGKYIIVSPNVHFVLLNDHYALTCPNPFNN